MIEDAGDLLRSALMSIPDGELLEPTWNYGSPLGFYYRVETSVPREDVPALLERLVDEGLAERVFYDRLSLCPNCESPALNVREICPSCGSSRLREFRALFHFRCGYTAAEESFDKEPDGLRCPKCRRLLRDLGTDYDSPGSFFQCEACTAQFQEPNVGGRCLSCASRFDQHAMQRLGQRDVYAYRLTERGRALIAGARDGNR